MKKVIPLLITAILLISGCRAHVDTYGKSFDDCIEMSFSDIMFQLPEEMTFAKDYNSIVNVQYDTIEDRDAARMSLVQSAIMGQNADGYLFTSAREYFFYVGTCSGSFTDITTASRDSLLNACARNDITYTKYGRCIENADGTQKAVMRVSFSVKDAIGEVINYDGYLGVARLNGSWYFYLAGYSNAGDDEIRRCFNYVRSLGE